MKDAPQDASPDSAAVLRFLSDRLDDLGPRIERIEAHASHMVAASPGDRERVIALQDLDLIRQVVEDLARLAGVAGRNRKIERQTLGLS